MAKSNTNSKKGFTIIEVVLVLAIAGLIFLMVFIALPAMQRSQRDTQRRNDMGRVQTALLQYQTNHSTTADNLPVGADSGTKFDGTGTDGTFPTGNSCNIACAFVRDYMNSASKNDNINEFRDPDGKDYKVVITPNFSTKDASLLQSITHNNESRLDKSSADDKGVTIGGTSPFSQYVAYIIPGGRCVDDYVVKSEKRHFAILYRLEGSGTYCIDSQ